MVDRPSKTLPLAALLLFAVVSPSAPLAAQTAPPVQTAQLDPSDLFVQAFMLRRAAEQLERDGEFVEAWEKMEQAERILEAVRKFHPNYKPSMVEGRQEINREMMEKLQPKAEQQREEKRKVVAELEGGERMSGRLIDPAEGVTPLTPGILEVDPLATRRLQEAKEEVKRLRGLLQNPGNEGARDASRVRDLTRQRDALASQLRAAEATVNGLRARLSASPMENEFKKLNERIQGLEMERDATARALGQSREQHLEAQSKIATLEADLGAMRKQAAEMRQKEADLNRDLKSEREIANSVVAGQRRQMEELEKRLEEKDGELKTAHRRIASLEVELEQSREAFEELREERNSLLRERDQMAALLKLNEAGRINDLIEQNMGLAKQLREANEKVERLNLDNNATKDDLTDALRDLAIAKSQINKLQQDKRDQTKSLAELEERLKREEGALARGEGAMDQEEAEVLRDLIKRQLLVQERRRQARDVLVEAAKELGAKDERLARAIELFDGEEIVLTPEEQRLIADKEVDGHFISPFARDRATVGRATMELQREQESYGRAAVRAFSAGRLHPAKELFQMMVEGNPGDVSALCRLGVVQLKLGDALAAADAFRRATELNEQEPFAYRMLGLSLLELGDYQAAETNVRRSTELAPDDATGHLLLGRIYYRMGRTAEAESHFKAAITADPMPSEPYYNLAVISTKGGRYEVARGYYEQALERGGEPDPALEVRMRR